MLVVTELVLSYKDVKKRDVVDSVFCANVKPDLYNSGQQPG